MADTKYQRVQEANQTLDQQVTNTNKKIDDINVINRSIFQAGLFATLYSFFANINNSAQQVNGTGLGDGLFRAVFATELLDALLAIFNLKIAKNKNIGKWFDAISSSYKVILVGFAVLAPFAVAVAPHLFLGVMGPLFLYNLGMLSYNIHKWRTIPTHTPEERKLKKIYANNIKKYTIGTLFLGIFILAIIATLILAPYIPAAIVATAGFINVAIIVGTAIAAGIFYLKQRFTKAKCVGKNSAEPEESEEPEESLRKKPVASTKKQGLLVAEESQTREAQQSDIVIQEIQPEEIKAESHAVEKQKTDPTNHLRRVRFARGTLAAQTKKTAETRARLPYQAENYSFYGQKFRALKLLQLELEGRQTYEQAQREYLLKEGIFKILQLELQMHLANHSEKTIIKLKQLIWSERAKREHKVELIEQLIGLLCIRSAHGQTELVLPSLIAAYKEDFFEQLKNNAQFKNYDIKNYYDIIVSNLATRIEGKKVKVEQVCNENKAKDITINAFDSLANDEILYKNHINHGAFQSVGRKVGDVQDYADAVEKFFKPELNDAAQFIATPHLKAC